EGVQRILTYRGLHQFRYSPAPTRARGSSLGTVVAMAIIATITIITLNSSAMAAANRSPTLSVLPRNRSDQGTKFVVRPLRDVKSAAEIATPNAAPRDEAIL